MRRHFCYALDFSLASIHYDRFHFVVYILIVCHSIVCYLGESDAFSCVCRWIDASRVFNVHPSSVFIVNVLSILAFHLTSTNLTFSPTSRIYVYSSLCVLFFLSILEKLVRIRGCVVVLLILMFLPVHPSSALFLLFNVLCIVGFPLILYV